MTEKKGGQDTYNPEEALSKIDKDKFPKLYETTERLMKSKEAEQSLKVRAEIAEKAAKKVAQPLETETPTKPAENATPTNEFSPKDYLALSQAGVPADDLDEVTDFAKYKGITIAEALKSSYIQSTLKEKAEERKTADATNTGGGKRELNKTSGKELLKKFKSSEELPESDEELQKLVEAELQAKAKLR